MGIFWLFIVPLAILASLWQYLRRRSSTATLENIPGPSGASWITGSINQLFNPNAWDFHDKIAKAYGTIIRTKGAFGSNDLYIYEPSLIQHVLIKDQETFEEPEWFTEGNKMLFGECLLTTHGNEHRRLRKMLNPLFSTTHLRQLVPVFHDVARKVQHSFFSKASNGPTEIDMVTWMTRLSLELIGRAGLGYTFDDLTENSIEHPYEHASKQLIGSYSQDAFLRATIMPKITQIGTPQFRKFAVDHMPLELVQKMRRIVQVMYDTSVEIFESKKTMKWQDQSSYDVGNGNDIITTLMKANTMASDDDKLTDEEVLSEISSLTFAATDTTSSALSRTLHMLAHHQDVQSKLRQEIKDAKKECIGQDFSYDSITSLPYLDAVLKETLRLYPPVVTTQRTARRDTVLPLATPVKGIDGTDIHQIPLPKGTNVVVSIIGSNRNPEVWGPDACEWKPDRWLSPLPESLINARIPGIYSHLMTFIAGGRACLGFKFSELEMKIVLAFLLEKLEFFPGSEDVVWQMNSIAQPYTSFDSVVPTLPMVIKAVES